MYRIFISSPAGMSYTGVWTRTEEEAKQYCDMYNEQYQNPYATHVYVKE